MIVFEDVVKMVNTARGKEKMFGYKSEITNLFHLVYVLAGGFYTGRTIRWQTKLMLISYVIFAIAVCTLCLITYLVYGDKSDLELMLYVVYSTFISSLVYILGPLLAGYFYSDEIKKSIRMADHIISKRSNCGKLGTEMDITRGALWITISMVGSGFTFFFFPIVHTALFYEIEKTKDYHYYLVYIPNLDKWGSMEFYFISNTILCTGAPTVYIFYASMTIIIYVFAGICHNEVQHIANDMNALTVDDITTVEMYGSKIEPKFHVTLKKATRDYRDLIRMLKTFLEYYKVLSGVMLSILFFIELSHAFNIIMPGTSFAIKFKEIAAFIGTAIPLFVYCWSGDILEGMTPTVSFATYSLPWYWTTEHRKDAYILLCQTQVPTDLKAIGVYPIQLRTFLRFLNVIQSTVNIIRAATQN